MARSKKRRAVLVLTFATPLLAACNTILGISDFEKGQCTGGGLDCLDSGRADVVTEGGPADAGPDVARIDAAGAAPVSWIQKPMPNYPGVPGADASVPGYAPTVGEGLSDSISELVWRPVKAEEKGGPPKTQEDAKKFCESVSTATTKWRLPTRIELVTLLDFSRTTGVMAAPDFNLEPDVYWTSSAFRELAPGATVATVTPQFWAIRFANDAEFMKKIAGSSTARVICVQGI